MEKGTYTKLLDVIKASNLKFVEKPKAVEVTASLHELFILIRQIDDIALTNSFLLGNKQADKTRLIITK